MDHDFILRPKEHALASNGAVQRGQRMLSPPMLGLGSIYVFLNTPPIGMMLLLDILNVYPQAA